MIIHFIAPRLREHFSLFKVTAINTLSLLLKLCFVSLCCSLSLRYLLEHPRSIGFLDNAQAKSSVYHRKLGIPGRQPTLTLAHSFCPSVSLAPFPTHTTIRPGIRSHPYNKKRSLVSSFRWRIGEEMGRAVSESCIILNLSWLCEMCVQTAAPLRQGFQYQSFE